MNPLGQNYSESTNLKLVEASQKGDKKALEKLINIHQPYIYNIAWKFTFNPDDAMDLTQETLIIVITKLSQFKFESQFRTWLYRIVVNQFLQSKRRKGETQFTNYEDHAARLDAIENADLDENDIQAYEEMAKEVRYRCLSGMIMCLTREQRLIFIVGETFGVDHTVGAEIFGISKQNYRVKLHRARKDLVNFMQKKCGLMNPDNPCRCKKKAKALHMKGQLTEDQMTFNVGYKTKVADFVEKNHEIVADIVNQKHIELIRDLPAKDTFEKESIIANIINDKNLMKYFDLQ